MWKKFLGESAAHSYRLEKNTGSNRSRKPDGILCRRNGCIVRILGSPHSIFFQTKKTPDAACTEQSVPSTSGIDEKQAGNPPVVFCFRWRIFTAGCSGRAFVGMHRNVPMDCHPQPWPGQPLILFVILHHYRLIKGPLRAHV